MTKSQNTKKDLCITSEQLTKQLATESLPEYTEFYVRKKDGSTDTQTWLNRRHSSAVEWWNTFNITEVLAPVPSYDELQNMNKAVNECMAANIKLVEQNTKLKELLKEWVQFEIEENPNDFTVMSERMSELANKTKEILK